MPTIEHEIKIEASPEAVFTALSTKDGIAAWQTPHIEGDGSVGSEWRFLFEGRPEFGWRVLTSSVPHTVEWECTAGPGDSVGTKARFEISSTDDGRAHLALTHTGWPGTHGNFRKCNTIWGVLLHHLKQAVETEQPAPAFPAAG